MEERWVVITTEHRGVFFGNLTRYDEDKKIAALKNARMCVYWSAETKGVLGLAATGPAKGSRITPEITKIECNGVTAILDCSAEAVKAWGAVIWT